VSRGSVGNARHGVGGTDARAVAGAVPPGVCFVHGLPDARFPVEVTTAGVDVGGTFTDVVYIAPTTGSVQIAKTPSQHDQADGVIKGLGHLDLDANGVELLVHGTTVATNALLQRTGATVGLICTQGFRDVVELRRRDRPTVYGLGGEFSPLVPRRVRIEVGERVDASGVVLQAVDPSEIRSAGEFLLKEGVEAVVVSFLHAYANPVNEESARTTLAEFWPNEFIVNGSAIVSEIHEFERTSTAVVSAYVQPKIHHYLDKLASSLRDRSLAKDVLVTQSNGGVLSARAASRHAVATILSGPAAGVIAGAEIAQLAGFANAITCDMGGTSLDLCLISQGVPLPTQESQLAFGVPIRLAMLDIHTIGAGGGSIASLDSAGILRVGPESAGSEPGPACYGRGGDRPTVTDANLVLGRLDQTSRLGIGSELTLDEVPARRALSCLGEELNLPPEASAEAVVDVANHRIAGAVRLISIERGFDPRDFALVSFGGAGGLHAGFLVRELGLGRALVPVFPGVTSALGCVIAPLRRDFVQTVNRELEDLDIHELVEIVAEHVRRGHELLLAAGLASDRMYATVAADMCYAGQTHTVRVSLSQDELHALGLGSAFERAYSRRFGYVLEGAPILMGSLRTAVTGPRRSFDFKKLLAVAKERARASGPASRTVYFDNEPVRAAVIQRASLAPGTVFPGPAIIEQSDATTFVDPGLMATVDDFGNLVIEVES